MTQSNSVPFKQYYNQNPGEMYSPTTQILQAISSLNRSGGRYDKAVGNNFLGLFSGNNNGSSDTSNPMQQTPGNSSSDQIGVLSNMLGYDPGTIFGRAVGASQSGNTSIDQLSLISNLMGYDKNTMFGYDLSGDNTSLAGKALGIIGGGSGSSSNNNPGAKNNFWSSLWGSR